jgi:hypothetical protein
MRSHAERSATPFPQEERDLFRTLAVGAVTDFLNDFRDSKTYFADATGMDNLGNCWKIAGLLRKGAAAGRIKPLEADDIVRKVGARLREGLHIERAVDLADVFSRASA